MPHKWFELASWRSPQEKPIPNGKGEGSGSRNMDGENKKENLMSHSTQPAEKIPAHSAREVPAFQVELLPMEEIYHAAGIMIPRKGYSINKVVEMLQSDHIRGLSKEMKRAAVLMALDAAGISIDQVQRDARARQEALDSYEATQTKQIEDEAALKAEENAQIQAELESVKAHYMARIGRNLDGIAREKAALESWLTVKREECQSMAEAIDLCLKSPVAEGASAQPSEINLLKVNATAAGAKPV